MLHNIMDATAKAGYVLMIIMIGRWQRWCVCWVNRCVPINFKNLHKDEKIKINLRSRTIIGDELKIPEFNIFVETARHYASLPTHTEQSQ